MQHQPTAVEILARQWRTERQAAGRRARLASVAACCRAVATRLSVLRRAAARLVSRPAGGSRAGGTGVPTDLCCA